MAEGQGEPRTRRVALYVEVEVPLDYDDAWNVPVFGLRQAGFVPIQGRMADVAGTSMLRVVHVDELSRAVAERYIRVVPAYELREEPS